MKLTIITLLSLFASVNGFSKTVSGYYRSNGTYVQSYERTSPDSTRSNNYGRPSSYSNIQEVNRPATRDYDRDGVANIYDNDDDNDGILDDNESY